MEKAGDFEDLAQCYADMGRHLDAARALERSGADGPDTATRLQDLLYRHLSALLPADEQAVRALQREAVLMEEQGKLIPALAFDRIFGTLIDEDLLPLAAFDMLMARRVVNVIMAMRPFHRQSRLPASPRISGLINSLSRAASDTGDPDLATCAAFAAGNIEGFERLASGIDLTDANAVLLAASSARCPEAVALFMALGRVGLAEMACRRNSDCARAGRYAEERGDMREAVRWFMDRRDYASALRCALSSRIKRAAARAYEHLGRFDEAIGMLTRLGKVREVERVRKKKEKSSCAG
jgi:hypothetical protein